MKISRLLNRKVRLTKNKATRPLAKVLNLSDIQLNTKRYLAQYRREQLIEICNEWKMTRQSQKLKAPQKTTELANLC